MKTEKINWREYLFRSQKNRNQEVKQMQQKAKILENCKNIYPVKIYINVRFINDKGYF